jgi:hypothetical protein
MLFRLAVVPFRLLIVVLPLVALPARLNVTAALVPFAVAFADIVTVVPLIEETVVDVEVGMPVPVITIPATIPLVLATVIVLWPLVQVPVVLNVVGSV